MENPEHWKMMIESGSSNGLIDINKVFNLIDIIYAEHKLEILKTKNEVNKEIIEKLKRLIK